MLHQHHVDIGVFTESWLNDAINGYDILRKDRETDSDGIICYTKIRPPPLTIDAQAVPALKTEFLPLFFKSLCLVVICMYHPFWNNHFHHEAAINCITDIIVHVTA